MIRFFNKAIRILLFTNGLVLVAGAMLGPIYALYVEKVGGDLLDASYAFAVFALVAGITTLVSGKYSDQLKENELIVAAGYVIMGVGFLGYMFVNSVFSLLVVQAFIGLGEAIYVPAFDAIYTKHIDGHKSGRSWGSWEAINYFTTAIGAVAGGFLVTSFGFESIFIMMGLLCFMAAGYIYRLSRKVL